MEPRQATVIARGHSRRGREAYETIPGLLRERGIQVLDTELVEERDDVVKAVRQAMKHKIRLIVVCGGDGTQTSVVPLFANRRFTLGVVPAGTGNSFAMGLGIDSFESAADAIAYGREQRIDLGVVNGTYFANFLTIGLSAQVAEEASRTLKSVIGTAAYGVAAVVPLLTHRPFRVDIRWKRHRVRADTHQLIVAGGRFYGHQPISPDATLTDGKLTVFVRDGKSKLDVMQTYLALMRGDQHLLSGVHLWSTSGKLKIRTKPKAPVAVDGCAFGTTPLRMHVAHRALRVMTHAEAIAKAS
jgi:YegS/Rv2252/BmrU family lipid kinase